MRLRLFDVDISVSCLFAAVVAFLFATDRSGLILPAFGAIVCHELGHLIAMRRLGCQPRQILLIPASVQIVGAPVLRRDHALRIALAGPLVNLLLFALLQTAGALFDFAPVLRWAALHLLFGLLNLLPARGLDGGTALFELLLRRVEPYRAERVLDVTTFLLGLAACFCGVTLFFSAGKNPTLLLLGIYLLIAALLRK